MAKASTKTSSRSSKAAAPKSSEQRAAADAAKHAAVALPSGGAFDRQDLQKGLDTAVDRNSSNRDAEVNKALQNARSNEDTGIGAPNAIPDHRLMDTTVQIGDGAPVREFRQVYDPKASGEAVERAEVAGEQFGDGQRSGIVSMEPIGDSAHAPSPSPESSVPAQDGESGEPGTTSKADAVADEIRSAGGDQ